jgi:hypothetical protein
LHDSHSQEAQIRLLQLQQIFEKQPRDGSKLDTDIERSTRFNDLSAGESKVGQKLFQALCS